MEFWSAKAKALSPYTPGEQPRIEGLVKLNTNESPLPPSPRALKAMREAANDSLRLYPAPESDALRETLAAYHGLRPENVFVGNGSDEVLAHAFLALLKHEKPLLFPDVTYSFYPVWAQLYDIAYETVPLDENMCVRIDDYRRNRAGAIVLANPNAPTGVAISRGDIARMLEQHADIPVVVDEAYVDFGGETAIPLISDNPNLIVVRTFSKSRALAGLRVGYALGQSRLIEALSRVKNSFNSYPLNRIAVAGAVAAVEDEAYFQHSLKQIVTERANATARLSELGFDILPSSANFIFARHKTAKGAELARALRERAVLVRHFNAPRIEDFLRITIGAAEQTAKLVTALDAILN
ncbi:histidinol-phosphate transaminase [Rhodoblastus acidophilus]|uniref:Histidinol-phosphate aminotransferase n=1 Tax=Candidatus Rhodoblastus alkanivorans TaxID=2954117 RepID=A0ABS9Z9M9_9HYPH|nr:histidinol-phosphate transaminase [Candidatus Rhodoblastus alkanivorans]MCI4680184.1 histidinol-phosphate transaminase [Candidatus Rhodoblastus alkanivorans]MCI4684141.1 histidinol-phosphate transaminase [Candidatus Rhodoblastus alkanivorans]MDI4641461.1 histidinol-phosphate transaminase [Rhodoblastus acidophilus]